MTASAVTEAIERLGALGATPNRPLATLAAGLIEAVGSAAAAVCAVPRAPRAALRQHGRVVAALARGDGALAQALLDEHLRSPIARAAEAG